MKKNNNTPTNFTPETLQSTPETGTIEVSKTPAAEPQNRSVQDPCRGTSSQTAGSQARTPCLPGRGDRPTTGHLLPCRL